MFTKTVSLGSTRLFEGQLYGPGPEVEVPENFPDPDPDEEGDCGDVNMTHERSFSSAPSTGGVYTGE